MSTGVHPSTPWLASGWLRIREPGLAPPGRGEVCSLEELTAASRLLFQRGSLWVCTAVPSIVRLGGVVYATLASVDVELTPDTVERLLGGQGGFYA